MSSPRTRRATPWILIALLGVSLPLAGCDAPPSTPETPGSTVATDPSDPGGGADYPLTGIEVTGGGDLVQGTSWVCGLDDVVLIDDLDDLVSAAPGDPVPSMALANGTVHYLSGRDPSSDLPLDGVVDGEGSYTVTYSAEGWPIAIDGEAEVTVGDDGATSVVRDAFHFAVSKHDLPDQCPPPAPAG